MALKLNDTMKSLLVDNELDNFTMQQIRQTYEQMFASHKSSSDIRKYLYRQLYRLKGEGFIQTSGEENTRSLVYSKTDKFKELTVPNHYNGLIEAKPDELANLKNSLIQCEVDLTASIVESQEYTKYIQANPHHETLIHPKLEASRVQSSSLLGKVNALKGIIEAVSREAVA